MKRASRAFTIVLEGATYEGSVALIENSRVAAERTINAVDGGLPRTGSGEQLMPAVAECLAECDVKRGEIVQIICGAGPGSFTSLRIAGSVAKGLATGYRVRLYAVSSLLLTVSGAKPALEPGEYLSVLDAMRGESYVARVSLEAGGLARQTGPATILSAEQLADLTTRDRGLRVIGPRQSINAGPHARGALAMLASILESGPVDLAAWEPDYGRLAEAQVRWEATHGRPLVG